MSIDPLRPVRDSALLPARDRLLAAIRRIYSYRMTTTSGGNLSIRDENGEIWITPARIDKGALERDDIVCVRPDGTVAGRHRPSSELPFHQAIYAARPDLRAVVHAHPVALVACSICGQLPETRLFPQARQVCGEPALAPYALPGSRELGARIAEVFARGHDCVILENHGVAVGGPTLDKAFARFETLEFCAKTILKAARLGTIRPLDDEQLALARKLEPLPTCDPPPPSDAERETRRQLCAFIRRGYQQRLFISTEGSFSARLGPDTFLITRRGCDRMTIEPEDLVLIDAGRAEPGKRPSQATRNHRAIYQRQPAFQAIVNADPVNATAFSVVGQRLDSRTIPESYLFLRDVALIPFGTQFTDPERFAEAVAPARPVALLENDGALVCGTSILDAFDRLEVLESTAEAIINAQSLGAVQPMPRAAIEELERAFGL